MVKIASKPMLKDTFDDTHMQHDFEFNWSHT